MPKQIILYKHYCIGDPTSIWGTRAFFFITKIDGSLPRYSHQNGKEVVL